MAKIIKDPSLAPSAILGTGINSQNQLSSSQQTLVRLHSMDISCAILVMLIGMLYLINMSSMFQGVIIVAILL